MKVYKSLKVTFAENDLVLSKLLKCVHIVKKMF